jgi:hypothetical protein
VGEDASTVVREQRSRWLRDALAEAEISQTELWDAITAASGAKRATVERQFKRWRAGGRMNPKYVALMATELQREADEVPNSPAESEILVRLEALETMDVELSSLLERLITRFEDLEMRLRQRDAGRARPSTTSNK